MNFVRCLCVLGLAANLHAAPEVRMISGVYHKGHNIMEPRPRESALLTVKEAGFMCVPGYVAYYAEVLVSKNVEKPYFLRVTFANPTDPKSPFVEEAVISDPPPFIPIRHGPVKGLKIGTDYKMVVSIYRNKGDAKPLDSLTQPIRSYLDTRGEHILIKGGLVQ